MNIQKLLWVLLLLFTTESYAQRACDIALPFCSNQSMTYPLGYDLDTINTNIDYSCLSDSLNPHWYTFVTTDYGDVALQITSTMGTNFSALVFGPTTTSAPCTSYTTTSACFDNTTSVSYTDASVPNGSIYHVLVLNNSDTTNQITANLSGTAFLTPSCPPAISNCSATVNTFTHTTNGQSLYSDTLCFLDSLGVEYGTGGSYPAEIPGLSATMPHEPGTIFFAYWKEPDNMLPPFLDPGLASFIPGSESDFYEVNSQDLQNLFIQYPFLQNKIYLKAFPAYNVDSAFVTHYCYDSSSPVIELTLLSPITSDTLSIDCANNSVEVSFSGSYPDLVTGQNFSVDNNNTIPTGLYVFPNNFANNSNVLINYLPDTLAPVNFIITDDVGCEKEISGYFGAPAPNFSYPDTVFCKNEGLVSPNINVPIGNVSFYNIPTANSIVDPVLGEFNADSLTAGNYQIVMETSFMTCSHDSTVNITIYPPPEVAPVQDVGLCPGESVELTFTSPSGNTLDFFWLNDNITTGIPSNGSGENFDHYNLQNNTLNPNVSEILYWSGDNICTSDTLSFNVEVYPTFSAGNDTSVCMGETITLNASGADSYMWEEHPYLSQNNIQNPELTVNSNSVLIVTATTTEGCVLIDTVNISMQNLDNCNKEISTAFSPNGDGVNDEWRITGIESYLNNQVSIFNRWGDLIISFEDYDNNDVIWNGERFSGQKVPAGTYYYVISTDNVDAVKGWVQVVK